MIRRPPRSTRTDTLFPYTTLFRAAHQARRYRQRAQQKKGAPPRRDDAPKAVRRDQFAAGAVIDCNWSITPGSTNTKECPSAIGRSEERRVGKGCVRTGRLRW